MFLMHKRVGETPLQALERARKARRIPGNVPMTYAGRLDPMASGTLLILVGDECKRQKEYHALEKEYDVEVLFGASSDTGDVLGIVSFVQASVTAAQVRATLPRFVGPYTAPYPRYSSKTVGGRPLFALTLEGADVPLPLQHGLVHSIRLRWFRHLSAAALLSLARKKIGTLAPVSEPEKALGRDFRKDEALASWARIPDRRYTVATIRVRVSSGVYMRTLAADIAQALGTTGLALSIRRTRIYREAR